MHDHESLKKFSDQQLYDLMTKVESRFSGISPSNQGVFELLCYQKDVIVNEIQERRMLETLRQIPLKPWNLTDDDLSRSENEAKVKQPKDIK